MPSVVKKYMYKELKEKLSGSPYKFVSSFDRLSVDKVSDLRRSLEKVAERSVVVKHTLAKKIFEEIEAGEANEFFDGHVLVTLGDKEPQQISKAIVDFAKGNDKFKARGVIFEGKVYNEQFVKQLASLPSREELLTQVVVRVQSPVSGFVNGLGQLIRGLVQALSEVKRVKEEAPQSA